MDPSVNIKKRSLNATCTDLEFIGRAWLAQKERHWCRVWPGVTKEENEGSKRVNYDSEGLLIRFAEAASVDSCYLLLRPLYNEVKLCFHCREMSSILVAIPEDNAHCLSASGNLMVSNESKGC